MTELIGRTTAGRVHVVRHSFEPNKPFSELIETFARPHVRPRFLLRSTKEIYVDSVTYARGSYRDEDIAAKSAVEQAKRHPFIIGKAAMRPIYAHPSMVDSPGAIAQGYRVAFLPTDKAAFSNLAASLDVYPSALPHIEPAQHYLYLDLPAVAAYAPGHEEAEESFKQTISSNVQRGLFSATVVGIRSMEVPAKRSQNTINEHTSDTTVG